MRIIVCGSRDWPESDTGVTIVYSTLQGVWNVNAYTAEPLTVVHGACPTGADKLASSWAQRLRRWREAGVKLGPGTEVVEERHPANWERQGRQAGPVRNAEMADLGAKFCLAFLYEPDGRKSRGTRNMMAMATVQGIPVIEVPWVH